MLSIYSVTWCSLSDSKFLLVCFSVVESLRLSHLPAARLTKASVSIHASATSMLLISVSHTHLVQEVRSRCIGWNFVAFVIKNTLLLLLLLLTSISISGLIDNFYCPSEFWLLLVWVVLLWSSSLCTHVISEYHNIEISYYLNLFALLFLI